MSERGGEREGNYKDEKGEEAGRKELMVILSLIYAGGGVRQRTKYIQRRKKI